MFINLSCVNPLNYKIYWLQNIYKCIVFISSLIPRILFVYMLLLSIPPLFFLWFLYIYLYTKTYSHSCVNNVFTLQHYQAQYCIGLPVENHSIGYRCWRKTGVLWFHLNSPIASPPRSFTPFQHDVLSRMLVHCVSSVHLVWLFAPYNLHPIVQLECETQRV